MIVPCKKGGHECSWPACSLSCDGRKGEKGLPADMTPQDAINFFSLPDDDDTMHEQEESDLRYGKQPPA